MARFEAEWIADYESCSDIMGSLTHRQVTVLQDWRLLADLPVNVVVEATGNPDTAAAIAELLVTSVPMGAMLSLGDLLPCPDNTPIRLRQEQDALQLDFLS